MTWKSHKIVTATSVFALTNNILFALIAAMGSIFPDRIEYLVYSERELQRKHRTVSHWFIPYLMVVISDYIFLIKNQLFIANLNDFRYMWTQNELSHFIIVIVMNILLWYCIGCLFHILEDTLCGSIPFLSPTHKIKLIRLFYVGSKKEYFYSFGFSILIILLKIDVFVPVLKRLLGNL